MTDEEIEEQFRQLIAHQTGVNVALSQVIQSLQAQPGYDHQAFERRLAILQVNAEQMETVPEEFRTSYQETLASFAKAQSTVPSLVERLWPPRKD